MSRNTQSPVTLRLATPADRDALVRLAALDSSAPPAGKTLVAVQEGDLVAAVTIDGRAIADPFRPTADVVSMLCTWSRSDRMAA